MKRPATIPRFSTVCAALILFLVPGCDETLPPRQDPNDFLQTKVTPIYEYSRFDNAIYLDIVLLNTYDETVEDFSVLSGQLTIRPVRFPSHVRTFDLSTASIVHATSYQPASKLLRADAGDSIVIRVRYDLRDDNGVYLPGGEILPFQSEDWCPPAYLGGPDPTLRYITARELFSLDCRVKVFSKIPEKEIAPFSFPICFADIYVSSNYCKPLRLPHSGCE